MNLALLPPLAPDAIEKWLALAAVIASLLLAYRRLFGNGRTVIRQHDCEKKHAAVDHWLETLSRRADLRFDRLETRLTTVAASAAAGEYAAGQFMRGFMENMSIAVKKSPTSGTARSLFVTSELPSVDVPG